MSRQLELDFLDATAPRRTRRGGVAQRDGQWLHRGRPIPEGVLCELYEVLAEDGLLQVAGADEYGLRRVSLSGSGENRYLELVRAKPTPLPVPPPEHPTGDPGDRQRRGWCVAGCGCALEIPPSGVVYGDCPACQPPGDESPAGRRHERAAPLDAAGDRPDLAGETGRWVGWVPTLQLAAGMVLRGRGGDRTGGRRHGPEPGS